MHRITLIPLQGITVGDTPIHFGQTKAKLLQLLGQPDYEEEGQLYYHSLDVRFDLDASGAVEFIECQGPYSEQSEFTLYGVNPFQLPADDLVALCAAQNNGGIDDGEAPYCYCFLESSVGLWRAFGPAHMEALIAEMKEEGTYAEAKEAMDAELEKSGYFWTVAVGKAGYYQ